MSSTADSTDEPVAEWWDPGSQAWFEYHCTESHESCDAPLWYRSHQQVTVLHANLEDEAANGVAGLTVEERAEACCPRTYQARWDDGFEGTVMEDELCGSPEAFYRPDPPPPPVSPAGGLDGP